MLAFDHDRHRRHRRPGRDAGIGTRLLPCAFADVRARGCCEVQIGVDAVDTDTRRFYERHGFSNLEPDTGTQMLLYLRAL